MILQHSGFASKCDDGFDYLALGNSITIHPICDYWPEEMGMAAESSEKDYVHRLVDLLEDNKGIEEVHFFAYNMSSWETIHYDRAETISEIDMLLNNDIDLVTVQLGENITDTNSLEDDFDYLVKHIMGKCPKAKIIIIGNFWTDDRVESVKEKIAERNDCVYISLKDIQDIAYYKSKIGNQVYDDEKNSIVVDKESVAKHPGNEGMKYIAEQIYNGYIEK